MSKMQTSKCTGAGLLIFLLFCMNAGIDLCDAQETGAKDPPLGVLKVEGTDLDCLVLCRRDGHMEQITRPEESTELPAGEYRLQEVRLKGGCISRSMGVSGYNWITVAADKPATLKVGGPLAPTVRVQREGRILRLSYELRGVGGETYTSGDRSRPPTFAVYKGQKQVASGKFEFG